ncbi:MAG: type II toxin-antitoxin system VapC family toxin [Blastocatellales bacterium]
MKLLLDTHIFLWFILNDQRLPESARVSIETESNEVFLSSVSVWEIAIKYQLNRLPLPAPASSTTSPGLTTLLIAVRKASVRSTSRKHNEGTSDLENRSFCIISIVLKLAPIPAR